MFGSCEQLAITIDGGDDDSPDISFYNLSPRLQRVRISNLQSLSQQHSANESPTSYGRPCSAQPEALRNHTLQPHS